MNVVCRSLAWHYMGQTYSSMKHCNDRAFAIPAGLYRYNIGGATYTGDTITPLHRSSREGNVYIHIGVSTLEMIKFVFSCVVHFGLILCFPPSQLPLFRT